MQKISKINKKKKPVTCRAFTSVRMRACDNAVRRTAIRFRISGRVGHAGRPKHTRSVSPVREDFSRRGRRVRNEPLKCSRALSVIRKTDVLNDALSKRKEKKKPFISINAPHVVHVSNRKRIWIVRNRGISGVVDEKYSKSSIESRGFRSMLLQRFWFSIAARLRRSSAAAAAARARIVIETGHVYINIEWNI